ncbi:dynamin-1-like protein [Thrips palmi]|uniref:Dynamin-1-like protein n=1 Tax=Thrips palmi TaxID=161013 RepID=A0A6P8XUL7_THRPL|nr:dynamin-1-like protein [Thrips palmi]
MAMRRDLLPKLNKIQDLFSTLGNNDPIELPKIVVVGNQSAGKSSVLESLVGKSFLPRGCGLVTRCPLVLQLNHIPVGHTRREGIYHYEEWGTFLHSGDRIFELEEICEEIEAETNRLAGSNKGIVSTPITLKVFSPNVVNLTLVDLPGMTKVPTGDQPRDIEEQIEGLILQYIESPLTIILAVVTANTDMVTNDSLKLAKRVDPEGERTLAVVTKIDLMDKGTDARDVLNGKVIPVKRGIVGVVNRSQKDIDENKSVENAVRMEKRYFEEHYKEIASLHGCQYLAVKLSVLLSDHINSCLPDVQKKILQEIAECTKTLETCGDFVTDKKSALMSIINGFSEQFRSLCDKGSPDLQSIKLTGGAKLCDILHSRLEKILASREPCKSYTTDEVIVAIRQSNVLTPPLFVSQLAFEKLIKPLIKNMEKPALDCVEAVQREMSIMCQLSIPAQLKRFPPLRQAVVKVVHGMINERAEKAIQMVQDLVTAEMGHITYDRIDANELKKLLTMENAVIPFCVVPFRKGEKIETELNKELMRAEGNDKADVVSRLELLTMSNKDRVHVIMLGKMLDLYYKLVAETTQDFTAKVVVTFLVQAVRDSLAVHLTSELQEVYKNLFEEKADIAHIRQTTFKRRDVLEKALEVIIELED